MKLFGFHSALSKVKYFYTFTSCLLLVWSHFWLWHKSHITRHIQSKLTWNISSIKPVLLYVQTIVSKILVWQEDSFYRSYVAPVANASQFICIIFVNMTCISPKYILSYLICLLSLALLPLLLHPFLHRLLKAVPLSFLLQVMKLQTG